MAEAPFAYFRELAPSQAVLAAEFFHCYNPVSGRKEEYLATLSSDVLSIYKVKPLLVDSSAEKDQNHLTLVFYERLFGVGREVKAFGRGSELSDLLILAVDIGKVIAFEFAFQDGQIKVISTCNIEEDAVGLGAELRCTTNGKLNAQGSGERPILRVSQPCGLMCLAAYGEYLFFSDLDAGESDDREALLTDSRFLVHLQSVQGLQGPILDTLFLSGFGDKPVVAVLQQEKFVPVGHVGKARNTCSVTVLCVNRDRKTLSVLSKRDQLPHDCIRLVDLRVDTSMFGIVSNNAFLIASVDQVYALPTNAFAAFTVSPAFPLLPHQPTLNDPEEGSEDGPRSLGYELQGSRWIACAGAGLIGVLGSGVVLHMQITWTLPGVASSVTVFADLVDNLGGAASYLALSRQDRGLFVCSSGARDRSTLFHLHRANVEHLLLDLERLFFPVEIDEGPAEMMFLVPTAKREHNAPSAKVLGELYHRDLQLFASSAPPLQHEMSSIQLTAKDELPCLGPTFQAQFVRHDDPMFVLDRLAYQQHVLHDGSAVPFRLYHSPEELYSLSNVQAKRWGWEEDTARSDEAAARAMVATQSITPASYIADREARDSLLLCQHKGLAKVQQGVTLVKVATRNFPGALRCCSLDRPDGPFGLLAMGYEGRTRVMRYFPKNSADLCLQEESSQFVFSATTLHMGMVHEDEDRARMVQITSLGVRLIALGKKEQSRHEALQDVMLADSEERRGLGGASDDYVISAETAAHHVLLFTARGEVFVLRYSVTEDALEVLTRTWGSPVQVLHASLYHGPLVILDDGGAVEETGASPPGGLRVGSKRTRSSAELEEARFYGAALGAAVEAMEGVDGAAAPVAGKEEQFEEFAGGETLPVGQERTVLVLTQRDGTLRVLDLISGAALVQSDAFVSQPLSVPSSALLVADPVQDGHEDGNLLEARLTLLEGALLLLLQWDSGELAVYQALCAHGAVAAFHRKAVLLLHPRRPVFMKRPRAPGAIESLGLDGEDFPMRMVTSMVAAPGLGCVLLSAFDPHVLTLHRGYPLISPLAFPETPFINQGHHLLCPLQLGREVLLSSMWTEYDDLELLRNPKGAGKSGKPCTFELYRMPARAAQQVAAGPHAGLGALSVTLIESRERVHRCTEIVGKWTESRTEQSLLSKRTHLMLTSRDVWRDFRPDVLGPEDRESEDVAVERYFPNLSSFCALDEPRCAPLPPVQKPQFALSLLQQGSVVDEYRLPVGERVVEAIVFYAGIEKWGAPSSNAPTSSRRQQQTVISVERRVMVLAATVQEDKRGEDTQSLGRILLFQLDYALFDQDDKKTPAPTPTPTPVPASAAGPSERAAGGRAATASASSAAFFENIQPKLRLLWAGQGPASILLQMPAMPSPRDPTAVASSANPHVQAWSNYVLATVGQTLYIYKLNGETMEMDQIAFFFAQFYISAVRVVKSFIAISDVLNSVQLLYFREEDLSIHLVAKDFNHRVVRDLEVLVDGPKMSVVAADDHGALQIFQHQPKLWDSLGGSRLVCQSEFALGGRGGGVLAAHDLLYPEPSKRRAPAPALPGAPAPPPPPPRARKGSSFALQTFGARLNKVAVPLSAAAIKASLPDKRSCVLVTTLDGALGLVLPVEEKTYKRLLLLQEVMARTLGTALALNPKDHRRPRRRALGQAFPDSQALAMASMFSAAAVAGSAGAGGAGAARAAAASFGHNKQAVLDGVVLQRFLALRPAVQDQLARVLGVTAALVKENLLELDYVARFF